MSNSYSNVVDTFGSIISTKTNVVIFFLVEHCFLMLSAVSARFVNGHFFNMGLGLDLVFDLKGDIFD